MQAISRFLSLFLLATCLQAQDCVICLHGLGRSPFSMRSVDRALQRADFKVVNQNYPSTAYPIEQLAFYAIDTAIARCGQSPRIHFVTHSMGGILLRFYLTQKPLPRLGRSVMLAPPHHGSDIVDAIGAELLSTFLGPAVQQLGTSPKTLVAQLGPVNFELGVIAGTYTLDPISSQWLRHPHDGKVSVASTKVAGMRDHITLDTTHALMMHNKTVLRQILYFLQHGTFLTP